MTSRFFKRKKALLFLLLSLFIPVMSFARSKGVGRFKPQIAFLKSALFLILLFVPTVHVLGAEHVKVGELVTLYYPYEITSKALLGQPAARSFGTEYVEVYDQGYASCTLRGVKAFSSPIIVRITYYYTNGSRSVQGTYDYYVYVDESSPDGISIYPSSITLNEGAETVVEAYVSPEGASTGYTWGSNDSYVAEVYSWGKTATIKANNAGTATIWVRTDNGYQGNCYVTVKNVNPTGVSIPNKLTVYAKEQATLTPTLTPSSAQTTYTWYSEDNGIAKVSGGTVEGVSEGRTHVYCRTANGLESNKCEVSVYYRTPTEISVSPQSITMQMNQTKQLSYTVKPSNAKYTVTWSSENPDVASVSASGLVTPHSGGSTRIVVATDNGKKAYCNVTVQPDPQGISLSQSEMTLTYGTSRRLSCTLYPDGAYRSLTWQSDNTAVARVSSDGTVTAVGAGTAVISVTTHNGKSATCLVEVPEPNFYFIVWLKDGSKTVCHLREKPRVEYSDGRFLLKGSETEMEYSAEDVQKFTLADNPDGTDGIEAVKAESLQAVRYGNDVMLISGCRPQAVTLVYTTSGACVGRFQADADGTTAVRLSSLPSGMLIVKTETITYKIMKK